MEAGFGIHGVYTLDLVGPRPSYMRCDFSGVGCEEGKISVEGQIVPKRGSFRYFGSMLQPAKQWRYRQGCLPQDHGRVGEMAASIWNPM